MLYIYDALELPVFDKTLFHNQLLVFRVSPRRNQEEAFVN